MVIVQVKNFGAGSDSPGESFFNCKCFLRNIPKSKTSTCWPFGFENLFVYEFSIGI